MSDALDENTAPEDFSTPKNTPASEDTLASEEPEFGRIALFVLVAFGIAWTVGTVLALTGGLTDSRTIASLPGFDVTLAMILLPTVYMFAPGIANVVTRVLTGEGWDNHGLALHLPESLRYYAAAWLLPAVLTFLGAGLFFLVFPRYFDPGMTGLQRVLQAQGGQPIDPTLIVVIQVVSAITIAPIINGIFAFGEEFGWRVYLLPKLLPFGERTAIVVHGLVWGIWHWPLILMGYEYGFGYPGEPISGLLIFLVFTVSAGTFLAWVTLESASVWPAVIGHGAVNAIAAIGAVFVTGNPNPLLGPLPVGLLGGAPWLVLAVYLLYRGPSTQSGTQHDDEPVRTSS